MQRVPELCFLPARKLAQMIRSRKVSATELTRAFIAQIEHPFHGGGDLREISAGGVHDALRLSRRAAAVDDVVRIGGGESGLGRLALRRSRYQVGVAAESRADAVDQHPAIGSDSGSRAGTSTVQVTAVTGRSEVGKKLEEVFPHLACYDLNIEPVDRMLDPAEFLSDNLRIQLNVMDAAARTEVRRLRFALRGLTPFSQAVLRTVGASSGGHQAVAKSRNRGSDSISSSNASRPRSISPAIARVSPNASSTNSQRSDS